MTYTALYRRFRPQIFGELVGQPHISRTLAAAIKKGGFVHAYLFCGPRGTGKTSTAKILARAVNCLEPTEEGEPCGACAACLRNTQGENLDILEIDAASNRGIDEIRDLRERVKYAPVLEKYKVYIIDEVHMLTTPAFNALLKTLEEPPPHVLFILATTEPHKIPLTVLSRCQRFDFRRIADAEVEAHLQRVADAEGYTVEPQALAHIARKVEGGLRDALSLLDQCAGASGGQITLDTLHMLTGAAGRDFIEAMTRHMAQGATAELLTGVAELYSAGRDLRQFLHDLLEYQRELLLIKLSPNKQGAPPWANDVQPALLLKLLSALAEGESRLRVSLQPRLTLELAMLSACGITEDRGQKTEDRKTSPKAAAMPEAGGQGTEDRKNKDTVGCDALIAPASQTSAKLEARSRKMDAGEFPQPTVVSPSTPVLAEGTEDRKHKDTVGCDALVAPASQTSVEVEDATVAPPATPAPTKLEAGSQKAEAGEAPLHLVSEAVSQKTEAGEAPLHLVSEAVSEKTEAGESPSTSDLRPPTSDSDGEFVRLQKLWPAIVKAVALANSSTGAFLNEAEPVALEQNKLLLCFNADYALFMNSICKRGTARKLVEQQITAIFGRSLSLEGTLVEAKATPIAELPELDQGSLF